MEIFLCLLVFGKAYAPGAGDIILLHQFLGEYLARLNLSSRPGGTKNLHAPDKKLVGNTICQRRFRSNDGEVNPLFPNGMEQRLDINRADVQILGNQSRAGITRRDINFTDSGALG